MENNFNQDDPEPSHQKFAVECYSDKEMYDVRKFIFERDGKNPSNIVPKDYYKNFLVSVVNGHMISEAYAKQEGFEIISYNWFLEIIVSNDTRRKNKEYPVHTDDDGSGTKYYVGDWLECKDSIINRPYHFKKGQFFIIAPSSRQGVVKLKHYISGYILEGHIGRVSGLFSLRSENYAREQLQKYPSKVRIEDSGMGGTYTYDNNVQIEPEIKPPDNDWRNKYGQDPVHVEYGIKYYMTDMLLARCLFYNDGVKYPTDSIFMICSGSTQGEVKLKTLPEGTYLKGVFSTLDQFQKISEVQVRNILKKGESLVNVDDHSHPLVDDVEPVILNIEDEDDTSIITMDY